MEDIGVAASLTPKRRGHNLFLGPVRVWAFLAPYSGGGAHVMMDTFAPVRSPFLEASRLWLQGW